MSDFHFPIRFHLHSRVEDFEEIYFENGKWKSTFQAPFYNYVFWSIGLLLFDIFLLLIAPIFKPAWVVLIMGGIISLYWWYETIKLFNYRWQWMHQTVAYLKSLTKIRNVEIILTEYTFQINIDEEEHISNWSNISYVLFNKQYINIKGSQEFTIPHKSLSSADLEILKNVIKKQMNREEGKIEGAEIKV